MKTLDFMEFIMTERNQNKIHFIKKFFITFMILFFPLYHPLFAKPSVPEWVSDYPSVYPAEDYIAELGYGMSGDEAKADALAKIARSFQSNVLVVQQATQKYVSNGDDVEESRSLTQNVNITASVDLFGVEYTEPYFQKKEKKWYSLAYINRKKALNYYQSKVENAKVAFYEVYNQAGNVEDSILRCRQYKQALPFANEFLESLEYLKWLNSKRAEVYQKDSNMAASLSSLIQKEKINWTVFVQVSGDYSNIITTAISKAFGSAGCRLVRNKKEANYICEAIIDPCTSGADPLVILPVLDLKIVNNKNTTVYSLESGMDKKTVAYSLEVAQKKAYPLFAEQISEIIKSDF